MRRGDSALWILTKMAMLFFIVALAFILVSFGNIERSSLCDEHAQQIAETLSAAFNQVLNSPLEDEGRTLKLETSLAIGEGKYSRYSITASKLRSKDPALNNLVIEVQSLADSKCRGVKSSPYPKNFDTATPPQFYFNPPFGSDTSRYSKVISPSPLLETMVFMPSNNVDSEHRSRYFAVLKCTSKTTAKKQYVFVQDCVSQGPSQCISTEFDFSAGGTAATSLCGFNN